MIVPTIGRQVWYWKHHENPVFPRDPQPEAATVVYVNNDRNVNLLVVDHLGVQTPHLSVTLRQPEDESPTGPYCEWMPYQLGQARSQDKPVGA